MPESGWPRLLYLADVPVEATYHGSALMYRLLQRYPASHLRIVEGNIFRPSSNRRLPGVEHSTLRVGSARWLHTRFHSLYASWLLARAGSRAAAVERDLNGFAPDAVLTVAHGYTWLAAARFAKRHRRPLHLIVHDDWPRLSTANAAAEHRFGAVYRAAASRLCVSPYMAEEYERRYGVKGTVLLPARAHDAARFDGPPLRLRQHVAPPVFGFAGTINSPGYAQLLRQLARRVKSHGGMVRLYGPLTEAQAAAAGLSGDSVSVCGLIPPAELLDRLRAEVDVLFVPMSFDDADRSNMRMSFPSKLTDYTSVGLPLLICGPADCSAVRWASENPGVAAVATAADDATLGGAVDRLCADREYRLALATAAQAVGDRDFSADAAERILHAALVA